MALLQETIPLTQTEAGDIFLEGSRIPLEVLVDAYNDGASPEELQQSYPSLELADIHAVILYYLRHRNEIDRYVESQYQKADQAREGNRFGNPSLIAKLRKLEG